MTSLIQSRRIAAPKRQTAIARLFALFALARQRRALREMEPHLLRDIGISADDAQKEGTRALWDAPENWHD